MKLFYLHWSQLLSARNMINPFGSSTILDNSLLDLFTGIWLRRSPHRLVSLIDRFGRSKPLQGLLFFTWEASRDCTLTIDKLKRTCKILVNWCCLCKMAEETRSHLLLWCPVAYRQWPMVYGLLGVNWVMTSTENEEPWAWRELAKRRDVGGWSFGDILGCSEGKK